MKTAFMFWMMSFCLVQIIHAQTANPPRTALIMGVGDYGQKASDSSQRTKFKGKPVQDLPGITNVDLPKMEAKLKSLGFTVTTVANPTLAQAKEAVDAFSARIKASPGVSLFYFSGHGGEYEGQNYLIPRRANISSKADLAQEALSAQRVLNGMEESGAEVNLVFLDCCRQDMGKSVGGADMAPLKARGSFIGFATRSGDFADPEEQGSPYTRFLLKHLDTPGISVADMYAKVTGDVKTYTKKVLGEERRPGYYSELDAPFYLAPVVAGHLKAVQVEKGIHFDSQGLAKIGRRVWENNCSGTVAGLVEWNAGEAFPSLGIGHFIWYPSGVDGRFQGSFADFIAYAREKGAVLPSWLDGRDAPCPWGNRASYIAAAASDPRIGELRGFLTRTVSLQADYLAQRCVAALEKMKDLCNNDEVSLLEKHFALLSATESGWYCMIDYILFKGEGIDTSERYNDQGWGLMQVLLEMKNPEKDTRVSFSNAAKSILRRRVENAPAQAAKLENRWFNGWAARCEGYSNDL